jgi:hypothetical protein
VHRSVHVCLPEDKPPGAIAHWARFRLLHHGSWWAYYRQAGQVIRRKIGQSQDEAQQIGAQVNAQLASGAPTLLAFTPITITDLRQQFLDYHEHVLRSSVATVCRYRAAMIELMLTMLPPSGRKCLSASRIARMWPRSLVL